MNDKSTFITKTLLSECLEPFHYIFGIFTNSCHSPWINYLPLRIPKQITVLLGDCDKQKQGKAIVSNHNNPVPMMSDGIDSLVGPGDQCSQLTDQEVGSFCNPNHQNDHENS